MRRSLAIALAVSALSTSFSQAEEPTLPGSAKLATREEFIAFVNGKTVDVVIYDAGKPLTAILKWDWKKKRISGSYVLDGKKGKVQAKWTFDGDKACSQAGNHSKQCHAVYIDGDRFYEMRDDGKVHAISKLKSAG
jgi:hypothetical protein